MALVETIFLEVIPFTLVLFIVGRNPFLDAIDTGMPHCSPRVDIMSSDWSVLIWSKSSNPSSAFILHSI